jgi:hypothetical protein
MGGTMARARFVFCCGHIAFRTTYRRSFLRAYAGRIAQERGGR